MIAFKIVNDDIVIDGSGNIELVEGKDETLQSVERALTTNLSEFFLSPEHGLEYGIIKTKNYNIDDIKSAITSCILQDDRITSVDSVDIVVDNINRNAIISFTATSEDETIVGEVSV